MRRILLLIPLFATLAFAEVAEPVKGMNITEIDKYLYDTPAINGLVDRLYDLGVRHIVLNPRGKMTDPWTNVIKLYTPLGKLVEEEERYARVIKYIHDKKMTVGIRPIFFVVDDAGNTPYVQIMPDKSKKKWWHGNIQPSDPDKWFANFTRFLKRYAKIAKDNQAEEFTLGAELFSMTVGLEDQWKEHPYGFPGRWLEISETLRPLLPKGCRIMYDINYTDATISVNGIQHMGGELARWHYRIVTLANLTSESDRAAHKAIVGFWNSLTAVGIDMYRSLATDKEVLPAGFTALTDKLQETSDGYAEELHTTLEEIEEITGRHQDVILKEVGCRSIERGFIRPFEYASTEGIFNVEHQAAAYEALFRSFWDPKWSWFKGVAFWDVSMDQTLDGPNGKGFSPLGKTLTEDAIKKRFQ